MNSGQDHKRFAVLFVDDEEQALKYFKMAFENDFQVLTASSVDAGWAIIDAANPPVGIVITDQRMPEKTGTQLLGRVRRTHPDIVRLLATAYSDLEAAVDAVNSGAIYKYLVKPWDVRELRLTLRQAMDYFLLKRERDQLLREKLSSLQHLLVADRVRSLVILAEGLSVQVRNTMTALQAYVELAREQAVRGEKDLVSDDERWRHLQWETEDATAHLLRLVQDIASATLEPKYEFRDSVPLATLLEASWDEARAGDPREGLKLELDVDTTLPSLGCSRSMLVRTFAGLFRTLLQSGAAADAPTLPPVRVTARQRAQAFNAEGISIEIVRPGFFEAWEKPLLFPTHTLSEDGSPNLLVAFFIVHHHGGTICLERDNPAGSGFRLTLPFSPESVSRPSLEHDAVERLFADLPRWEALERGG